MRRKEIVGEFGEVFVAQTMVNLGYDVDRLDAEGIDLSAYLDDERKYGISVKSRCIQNTKNDSINLTYNDICYTYEQSKKEGLFLHTHLSYTRMSGLTCLWQPRNTFAVAS